MTAVRRINTQPDPRTCTQELHIQRCGWAVLHVRPGLADAGQVLWEDLLRSLGRTTALSTRGRAMNHAMTRVLCNLAVAEVDHLAVGSANDLTPTQIGDLCALTACAGVTTWLLYDVEPADEKEAAVDRLAPRVTSIEEFLGARQEAQTTETREFDEAREVVPDAHFLNFLPTAQDTMSGDGYKRVRDEYINGRRTMAEWLEASENVDEDHVSRLLHELTCHTSSVNDVLPLIRGAQSACLMAGWNVQVDVRRWTLRAQVGAVTASLTDSEWEALGTIQRPGDAACCALAVLGTSAEQITRLPASAFAPDMTEVMVDGHAVQIPKPARPLLRAQMIQHQLAAGPDDPFLTQGVKEPEVSIRWVTGVLDRTAKETGITLRARTAGRTTAKATRWTHRSGLSVKALKP